MSVNYFVAGPEEAQPFLLIHGFGASGFHWRRNVNVLAGAENLSPPTDAELKKLAKKPETYRMSCQAFVNGDVEVEVPPAK